jgi:hypothetical protein
MFRTLEEVVMNRRITRLAVAAWVLATGALEAQQRRVTVGDRRINIGQTKTGRLTSEDWAQVWQITLPAGRTVTIELTSDAFDGFLAVRGPGLDRAATDDDTGPGCDARVVREVRTAGAFTVLVTPAPTSAIGTGEYSLMVRDGAAEEVQDDCNWEDRDAPWLRADARRQPAIRMGETATGQLGAQDSTYRGTPYRLYAFSPRANVPVTIDLDAEFDALLRVAGGGLRAPLRNDDGGAGCDARIVHTFPNAGPYLIQVTAISDPASGPYRLAVKEGATDMQNDDECSSGGHGDEGGDRPGPSGPPADVNTLPRVRVGQTLDGRLVSTDSVYDDDTYYQLFALKPQAGATITIDLHSDAFDAFLMVRGGDLDRLLTDDDDGPGCDARIVHTFRGEGPYVILVNTVGRATGAFTLKISEGGAAGEPGGCDP